MRGERARSGLNAGKSVLMEQMNGKRSRDVFRQRGKIFRNRTLGKAMWERLSRKEWSTGLRTADRLLN